MTINRNPFKRFLLQDGKRVVLRRLQPSDLNKLLVFINSLVEEKRKTTSSQLFTGFENYVSRQEEAHYLRKTLVGIKQGMVINVVAEVNGAIVGNGEIARGGYEETKHYGHLGLTILSEWRGHGIGTEMIKTLLSQARKAGLRTVYVEFLGTNNSAFRAYRKNGFIKAGGFPGKVLRNRRYIDSTIMVRHLA